MEKKTLWIATTNEHKIREFKSILQNYNIKTILDLPDVMDIEEHGKTFEENAVIKAEYLAQLVNEPVIGDDTGLSIDCLGGFPGIYSRRWAYPIINYKEICYMILEKMNSFTKPEDRQAEMITALCFYNPKNNFKKVVFGIAEGSIATHVEVSDEAFGYDFIFIPKGYQKTYAALGEKKKNSISSRILAINSLKELLESNFKNE